MATKPIPFGPILDDSGALVAGATITIASVKDTAGTNIAGHGATLNDDGTGLRVSVNYDAQTKGEAWIALAVSKTGSTFTGIGAAPTMFAAADSFTLDSIFSRLGAPLGASVSADTLTLLTRLSAARAGYLDNLNTSGIVASQADITALNQSASRRMVLACVSQMERPESGNSTYTIELRPYDGDGAATNATATPTIVPTGILSGSLVANLSAVSNPATGVYRATYTVAFGHALEQVRFDGSAAMADGTFALSAYSQVCDFVAATFSTTDRTNLTNAAADALATKTRVQLALPAVAPSNASGLPVKSDLPAAAPTVGEIQAGTSLEDLATMVTGDGTGGAKFTVGALENAPAGGGGNAVITRSGPSTITAVDSGIDGQVGLFVGDRYSLTLRALIGTEPPGGTGADWLVNTTDEATGVAISTDVDPTMIAEELGYMAYALAAGDTVSSRRVRLTAKRTIGSEVRIFGPLVLNVRDR